MVKTIPKRYDDKILRFFVQTATTHTAMLQVAHESLRIMNVVLLINTADIIAR